MERREFLRVGGVAATLPLTARQVLAQSAASGRFAFGYHSGEVQGVWMDATSRPFDEVAQEVRIEMLGIQAAAATLGAHPLQRFDVELLYRADGMAVGDAAFRWASMKRSDLASRSKGLVLTLAPDRLAALRVSYTFAERGGRAQTFREELAWVTARAPMLTPGFYVLVGPSASTGKPPEWRNLVMPGASACGVTRCNSGQRDFDAILIAVEAV